MLSIPEGKQAVSVARSNARINIWDGSVRSGKTVGSIFRWLKHVRWFAETQPGGELMMIGKTERTLERNVLAPLMELLGADNVQIKRGTGRVYILGVPVYMQGASNIAAEDKIRGITLAGCYGDEVTLWPEEVFKQVMFRLSVKGSMFFGTTNPDGPVHWLKTGYLDREGDLDLRRFHFKLADNKHLEREYIEALEAEYVGLWRRRYILGEWVLAEGLIWESFDLDTHCIDELPPTLQFRRYSTCIDYGTKNPFVALLLGEGNDNRLYVLSEFRWDSVQRGRQLSDAEYALAFRRWLGHTQERARNEWLEARMPKPALGPGTRVEPDAVFVDPSAISFMVALNRDGVSSVRAANNAVDDGLRFVGSMIAADCVRVLRPKTSGLVEEICGYSWDDDAAEKGIDQPLKVADHGPDALRYGCASQMPRFRPWLVNRRAA